MTYEQWRITYQSDSQAARAAFKAMRQLEKSLNERAKVEQELWDAHHNKGASVDAEQLRDWALRLGVPAEWRGQK